MPWRLHVAGWALLWALYFVLDLTRVEGVDPLTLFVRAGVWAAGGLAVAMVLARIDASLRSEGQRPAVWFALACVQALVGGALWLLAFTVVDFWVELEPGFEWPTRWPLSALLSEYMSYVFPLIAWLGVVRAVRESARAQQERARGLAAEREAAEAKLGALRQQLNPHFLFNALNSATELTRIDPEAAEAMLVDLSVLLRETLKAPRGEHALQRELELVRRYIAVETRRFGEALVFDEDLGQVDLARPVPTLAVHTLVENAVKHGMRGREGACHIALRLRESGVGLEIRVTNDGRLSPAPSSSGVGLTNLRERLRVGYPGESKLDLTTEGEQVVAMLQLGGGA